MIRYHDALDRCLEAVAVDRDLDEVIASLPRRHRERLRNDARLADALRSHAASIPAPSDTAEMNALSRLNAELNAERVRRAQTPRSATIFGVPRFALAGLLLAAFLAGAGFLLFPGDGNNGTVEAAEFEGVVVASGDGSLTVQTLDTLEEIMVPLDALVLDEDGSVLQLAALETGEVVLVRGDRPKDGPVRASDIRRRIDGLPGWCDEDPERCRRIAENLEAARDRCLNEPSLCRPLHDRVTDLIARVTDVADLEDLKRRCVEGGEGCRDIVSFCQQHPAVCVRDIPPEAIDRIEDARARFEELEALCRDRDTRACRQVARICEQFPLACTDQPPAPSSDVEPTGTPASDSQTSDTRPVDSQRTPPPEPTATPPPPDDGRPLSDRPSR